MSDEWEEHRDEQGRFTPGNPGPRVGAGPEKYRRVGRRICELAREGKLIAAWAADLGVSKATLRSWAHRHPDTFGRYWEVARTLAQAWWEEQGRENLSNRSFRERVWDTTLKNNFRGTEDGDYSSTRDVQVTTRDGDKADERALSDDEVNERIRRLEKMAADRAAARAALRNGA